MGQDYNLGLDEIKKIRQTGTLDWGDNLPPESATNRRIKAEIIKRLLFGLAQEGETDTQPIPGSLTIRGAWIDGELDLRDLKNGDEEFISTVKFENCVLPQKIDLSYAYFARLSFEGCRLTELIAKNVTVKNTLNLCDIKSAQEGRACTGCKEDGETQGLCSINLIGATIKGDVKASGSILCCQPYDENFDSSAGGIPYALNVSDAHIKGSLLLQPGFVAFGGVRIVNALIDGNVWLQGAHIYSEWADAIALVHATIRKSVVLSTLFRPQEPVVPFHAKGCINLYGVHIRGELYIAGAKLEARAQEKHDAKGIAIKCYMGTVEKNVRLAIATDKNELSSSVPTICNGQLMFRDSKLGGFSMAGVTITPKTGVFLDLTNTKIGNDLTITEAQGYEVNGAETSESKSKSRKTFAAICEGKIFAENIKIGENLKFIGVQAHSASSGAYFGFKNSAIGAELITQNVVLDKISLNFKGTNIKSYVRLTDTKIKANLDFSDASIGSSFEVFRCTIAESFNMPNCMIEGDLRLKQFELGERGLFNSHVFSEFNASGMKIGGAVSLEGRAGGNIVLKSLRTTGRTRLENLTLISDSDRLPQIDLEGSQLEGGVI